MKRNKKVFLAELHFLMKKR